MSNPEKIIRRITNGIGIPNIVEILSRNMGPTDLQSLLLETYRDMVSRLQIKDILRQHEDNSFVKPSAINQKISTKVDKLLYDCIPKTFDAVELSPLNPLGTNSIIAGIDQRNVISTIRNTEVSADATTALALECAKRRKSGSKAINLCTSHRTTRAQNFDAIPGFLSHFRIFALASADRDRGFEKFETENLLQHLKFYLSAIKKLSKMDAYEVNNIEVFISDMRIIECIVAKEQIPREEIRNNTQNSSFDVFSGFDVRMPRDITDPLAEISPDLISYYEIKNPAILLAKIKKNVIDRLIKIYPQTKFVFEMNRIAGIGHYETATFKIRARNRRGEVYPLVDGGVCNWTKRILANKKERLMVSGFGTELFCMNFN